nr:aldehyde dehydrogenase family protein [Dactylosporangium thailandense]
MTMTSVPLQVLPEPALLIGAQRRTDSSGGEHDHVYAATGRRTVTVPVGGPSEIDEAVRAAAAAAPGWRATAPDRRRDLLLELARRIVDHAERLGMLQTVETAVPRRFATRLPQVAADFLTYCAGWADKDAGEVVRTWPAPALDYTLDEPYGVVAVIVPWNAPLPSIAQVLAPALAAGNTVVLKPPPLAPFTALAVAELALDAGIPPGVVNAVATGPEGGAALVGHAGVDKIHFTGSAATGQRVLGAAAANLTPVCLELGGKSAHVIFADADLRMAARQVLAGLVVNSGQMCVSGTRVLVQAAAYDEVLATLTKRLRHVSIGDPLLDATLMGPVISEDACRRILGVVERTVTAGEGRLVTGGERLGGELGEGYFLPPTVLADIDHGSELVQQEVFGPVLSLHRFDTEQDGVRLANATRYGLAAYVHTTDLRRAHRVAAGLVAGTVWVNGFPGVGPAVPFGGTRHSGFGRVGGRAGMREFSRPKNVWVSL